MNFTELSSQPRRNLNFHLRNPQQVLNTCKNRGPTINTDNFVYLEAERKTNLFGDEV